MSCGACKYLRRRCGGRGICLLAPHFPVERIQRFACVHHVFGGCSVNTILKFTEPKKRGMAVQALSYQAEARVRDPVHGCVGLIMELEETHHNLTEQLRKAHAELSQYMDPKDINALCPRYGDFIKGKKVDTPMSRVLFDLDSPSLPRMSDKELDMWDPFPNFPNVGLSADVDRAGPSSLMQQHPQCDAQMDQKLKSIIHPSS